jgi:hypothetical protein
MGWTDQLGNMLNRYAGTKASDAPDSVHRDFDDVAQGAPSEELAGGLAASFRSDETPPFPKMLGTLFNQGSGHQRAGILSAIIGALGPQAGEILGQRGGALGQVVGSGQTTVPPEVADQVPPDVVEQMAHKAQERDPSVIDRVSALVASHPGLVKTLGGGALAVALGNIASRRQQG